MGSSQRGCVVGMGATQVAIGIFCFIFQIGAFIIPTSYTAFWAPGIWGPIFVSINSLAEQTPSYYTIYLWPDSLTTYVCVTAGCSPFQARNAYMHQNQLQRNFNRNWKFKNVVYEIWAILCGPLWVDNLFMLIISDADILSDETISCLTA